MADREKSCENAKSICCNYCAKSVVTKTQCVNCGAYFHRSCYSRKKCCDSQQVCEENKTEQEVNDDVIPRLIKENLALKQENENLRSENESLRGQLANVNSLEEIKVLIRNECEKYFDFKMHQVNKNKETIQYTTDNSKQDKNRKVNEKQDKITSHMDLVNKQTQLMHEIINLDASHGGITTQPGHKQSMASVVKYGRGTNKDKMKNDDPNILSSSVENNKKDDFIEVQRRRKPKKVIKKGTYEDEGANDEPKFESNMKKKVEEKRLWLFISRARDHVTTDMVTSHIAQRGAVEVNQISVRLLETRKQVADNKCFMIGVPTSLQETIYKDDFWPRGIGFERFDFRRGQHFLEMKTGP